MDLPKLSRVRLADKVVKIIYDRISTGELRSGDKLPGELELSKQMGIARTTVREALGQLIGLGLVERGENGMRLSEEPVSSIQSRVAPLLLKDWELKTLYEARKVIEGELAVLSAARATAKDIDTLKEINSKMLSTDDEKLDYWEKDMSFHKYVAKIANNDILYSIHNVLCDMFKKYEQNVMELETVKKSTFKWHSEFIGAIEKQDVNKIRDIVRASLQASEEGISKLLVSRNLENKKMG
ncbi:FadR/GntR family transcriptional regulator [Thermodesulfobacteriota bacterium]